MGVLKHYLEMKSELLHLFSHKSIIHRTYHHALDHSHVLKPGLL